MVATIDGKISAFSIEGAVSVQLVVAEFMKGELETLINFSLFFFSKDRFDESMLPKLSRSTSVNWQGAERKFVSLAAVSFISSSSLS